MSQCNTTATTTATIRDYTPGREIGEAQVASATLEAYQAEEIGQWPGGIVRADELLSDAEIDRLGIESSDTVWIEV